MKYAMMLDYQGQIGTRQARTRARVRTAMVMQFLLLPFTGGLPLPEYLRGSKEELQREEASPHTYLFSRSAMYFCTLTRSCRASPRCAMASSTSGSFSTFIRSETFVP